MATAADIWAGFSALLEGAQVDAGEVAVVHGLVPAAPLQVSSTERHAGDVTQTITQSGDLVTVSRA